MKNAVLGIISTLIILTSIFPSVWGNGLSEKLGSGGQVLVTDKETGTQYSAYIAGVWNTKQGQCHDTDNGFKPDTSGQVFLTYHHPNQQIIIDEYTQNGYLFEPTCGKDIRIEGVSTSQLNKLAVAFWYPVA